MRDTAKSITDLYQRLRPHILRDIQPGSGGAGSGGAGMVAHSLAGAYHTGTLLQSQAPWAATKADLAALVDTGMIHDRVHELASTSGLGADHTVSGLTAGQYLRASSATDAAFAAIQDADIPSTIVRTSRNITAGNGLSGGGDLSADRTLSVGAGTLISVSTTQVSVASGSAYQYIGTGGGSTPSWRNLSEFAGDGLSLSGAALTVNVSGLGLSVASDAVTLTSSSSPGAAASILASDATGKLTLPLFVATTSVTTPTLASGAATELAITSGADTYLNPGSNIVKLGTDKLIRSYSFTSGFAGAGWQIDQSSGATNAEFDNLTVRGTMRVYELLIQQIRATNGSIFVTAAAKLASASLISGSSYDCYVEGDSGDYAPFAVGDVLRAQRVNLGTSTVVYRSDLTVTAISVGGNPLRFTATLRAGTTAPAAGMEFVRLGSTSDAARRGSIYLTADDSGAPYIDVVNGVTAHTDWNTVGMVKVRIGRLDGITGNSNEYGIWAGTGTGDTAQSIVASSASVSLNNVPLRFKAGSSTVVMELAPGSSAPYMALGSTLPTGPLVGNGLWMGKDGSDYEFRVGTVSGGALVKGIHWDGSNLTWKATNTTLDASGNLTASNATLSGTVTATAGAIGGWSLSASGLTATNIGLYSGAANTARVQVGTGSDANTAGVNSANGASDIAFWAGSTHANRASAPFRVTAAGGFYATTGSVLGDLTVSGSGRLIAGGGDIIQDTSGMAIGLYTSTDVAEQPGTNTKSITWYTTPNTRTGLQVRQYVGLDSSSYPHWNVTVDPGGASPATLTLWHGGAINYLWLTNINQVVGMPGLLLATGSPNTVQILSGARLQLNSGSAFVATAHLEAGTASTFDIGASGTPWRKIYVDEVVAGTITGGTALSGQTWQYDSGDMYIKSSHTGTRTLYISNPGTGGINLDLEGSITLSGTVDGVDVAALSSAYNAHYSATAVHGATGAVVGTTNTQTLTNKTLTSPAIADFSNAQHDHTNASSGGTIAHGSLSGIGVNSHAQIDTHIATGDTHVAHSGVTFTAGAGLTGGGTIAASRTFAVGAGAGITVNADDVALTTPGSLTATSTNSASGNHTHAIDSTIARAAITLTAGAGLTGGGDLSANRTFAVGAGAGITVNADDVALTTPGTLTVATTNSASGSHTHAITSSSSPGAAASLLATNASGGITLDTTLLVVDAVNDRIGIGGAPGAYKLDVTGAARVSDDLYVDDYLEVDGATLLRGNLTVGSAYATPGVLYVNAAGMRVGINRDPDSQFDLDVAGAIRGQYLVGRHAIQLDDPTAIFHFDGPGPHNLDYSGTDFSHLGVPGSTVTGGVIYRPGRFGKAVQLAEATTNRITDPSFETGASSTSSEAPYFRAYNMIAGTSAQSSDALFGLASQEIIVGSQANPYLYRITVPGVTVAAGQTWTFSAYVKASNAAGYGKTITIRLREDGSGSYVSSATTTLTYDWQRVSVTRTLTKADVTQLNHYITLTAAAGSAAGWLTDGAQLEQLGYVTPYCDGSLGTGHTWSGTAHASTSTRTGAAIEYPISLINAAAGTIMAWVYPESFNVSGGFVWYAGDAAGEFDAYFSSIGTLNWRINGATAHSKSGFAANTWVHLAFTWDTVANESKLFVDGVQYGSTGTYSAVTLGSIWRLGNASYGHNGLIDDLIILGGAADPKLIRSIVESDAPVFASSSVVAFRSPSRVPITLDEYGMWMQGVSGNAIMGVYGGDPRVPGTTRSWGGVTMDEGDVVMGRVTDGGALWWDDSEATLLIGNSAAEHIAMDGATLEFKNSTRTWASLSGNSFVVGEAGGPQVAVGTGGLFFLNSAGTPVGGMSSTSIFIGEYANSKSRFEASAGAIKMIWRNGSGVDTTMAQIDASGNASFTGNITASGGSFTGVLDIGASGGIYQGTGTFGSPYTGLKIWRDGDYGRIGGYLAGAVQWYANTDGRLYAGGGNVQMDANGVTVATSTAFAATNGYGITQHALKSSGVFGSYVSALNTKYTALSTNSIGSTTPVEASSAVTYVYSVGKDDGGGLSGAQITLWARDYNSAGSAYTDAYLEIYASKVGADDYIKLHSSRIEIEGPFSLSDKLYLTEIGTTPSAPGSGVGANVYIKGDKLVLQFNDGGTTRYKYLDLTGTGVTWVHTTTAP